MATKNKRYKIGNILRDHFEFKATDEKDAWNKGIKIFLKHYPGSRMVTLYEFKPDFVRNIANEINSSSDEKYYTGAWIPILRGFSGEEYPEVVETIPKSISVNSLLIVDGISGDGMLALYSGGIDSFWTSGKDKDGGVSVEVTLDLKDIRFVSKKDLPFFDAVRKGHDIT